MKGECAMSTRLSEVFNVFMSLRTLGDGTREIYKQAVGKLIAAVGDGDPAQITPLAAQAVVGQIKDSGICATTVNINVRCIKTLFNWMVDSEIIPKTPFAKIRALKEDRKGKQPYTAEEVQAALNACPNNRWRMIVGLAITTGMRRGEIMNLTVGEVDYANGAIRLAAKPNSATTWEWTIKDAESRTMPIHGSLESLMLRIQASLPEGQPYLCLTPARYQHLMAVKQQSGVLPYDLRKCPECNFLRTFRKICRDAGIAYKTFHATRGTGLSLMAENGLQPHEIAKIAGHSDVRTTYQHYVRTREQELLQKARTAAFNGRYRT
jgi:integrase